MGHGTRSQVLINIQIQDGVSCLLACFSVFTLVTLRAVSLEARQRLESIKTLFTDIICLKELENYLLVRSISLDEDKSWKV